jgi:hypothetical protein
MAHVRAVGLLVLLSAVPAVTIELTPRGTVWLWLHVWTANVLWVLFGHHLATPVETAAA